MLVRSEAGVQKLEAIYWSGNYQKKRNEPMGTNGVSPKREVVQFTPNQPVTLALRYTQPKVGMRPGGGDYAMFTTADNRVLFLDPEVAHQITTLGIQPGEEFHMEMRWSGKRGDPKIYHAWQDKPEQPQAETELEAKLRLSIEAAKAKKAGPALEAPAAVTLNGTNGSRPPAPEKVPDCIADNHTASLLHSGWAAHIREQTQIKLAIYNDLCEWAKQNFPTMTRREVSSFLMNVLISSEKGIVRR